MLHVKKARFSGADVNKKYHGISSFMELPKKVPVCPFCAAGIRNATDVVLGTKTFFLCPECSKILSVQNE